MITNILVAIITSGAVSSIISYLIIGKEKKEHDRWDIKRQACLDALSIIDGYWSNQNWDFGVKKMTPQDKPKIEDMRGCHNRLCITCNSTKLPSLFMKCLGFNGEYRADIIVDFRNEIRRELEIKGELDMDRKAAFIGYAEWSE